MFVLTLMLMFKTMRPLFFLSCFEGSLGASAHLLLFAALHYSLLLVLILLFFFILVFIRNSNPRSQKVLYGSRLLNELIRDTSQLIELLLQHF